MSWSTRKRPALERFWEKVDKSGECWNWTANKSPRGYGSFGVGERKNMQAHRFSWTIHYGEIPNGMYVCHHCDNPQCVRPDHLFLGTQLDNMRDCWNKGRAVTVRGENHLRAKLTAHEVRKIRSLFGLLYQREIAELFGVTRGCIESIKNGSNWKSVQ